MVLSSFQFSNLLGTVYKQGNVCFSKDGNTILSPVGNRVAVFDLVNNKSRVLNYEHRKNVARIALSPDSNILLSVDTDGRAMLVHFKRSTVLHHFNFKAPVNDVQFSPNGKYILVTKGNQAQVWLTPSHMAREFAPFVLHKIYTGHYDEVLSVQWSPDSRFFLTTSKDMTARLYIVEHVKGYKSKTFSGHKDYVLAAYFSKDQKSIYTVGRDGAVYTWTAKSSSDSDEDEEGDVDMANEQPLPSTSSLDHPVNQVGNTRWGVESKHFCNQPHSKVTSVTFHSPSSLLIVGFSNGVFGLWEMPSFNSIHTLSISQEKITSVAVNASGEWLAFGASKLGQLLVWEWQSESYILKQQGHYFDMNCIAFSPEDGGQYIVTGGDDGKVKIWNASSGFCFVTFDQHTSSVSAVEFAKGGQVVFSASLDGTVRAFDMVRYRNFRTFTSPEPVQFNSLAVDPSGEIVAAAGSAASTGNFEIYVWSTQTGKLIEVLPGHEGPISNLAFAPAGDRLASSSWDGSARTWELYGRKGGSSESFNLGSDGLSLAWRPDGKELAVTNLSGQILFFDPKEGRQVGLIEGRRDVGGGRKADDRRTAANSESGKAFTSVAYTADGSCVLAGGNSKHVCLYDVRESVLLRKWTISENLALDGTQEFLDSRKITADGVALDLIDDTGDASDLEDRLDANLPGAIKGDMSKRKYRPEVRTKCIRFSPAGRSWAAASTEGLLVYSLDSDLAAFDPFDLDLEITPDNIDQAIDDAEHLKALVMAFRLNEQQVIRQVYESVAPFDVPLLSAQLPEIYAEPLIRFIAGELEQGSRHVEFNLMWIDGLIAAHGRSLKGRAAEVAATLRSLQKALQDCQQHIVKICDENSFSVRYLIDQAEQKQREAYHASIAIDIDQ